MDFEAVFLCSEALCGENLLLYWLSSKKGLAPLFQFHLDI
jgi:hypothetical protein